MALTWIPSVIGSRRFNPKGKLSFQFPTVTDSWASWPFPIRSNQRPHSPLRPFAPSAFRLSCSLGDNRETALAVARKVNIDRVLSEVRPDEKAKEIERLMEKGASVAMVGDGINDAPALARAHLGIAMGTGAHVAIETGDIVLSGGNLLSVPRAISLGRAVMRTIRQNLFWAFGYNILLVPVAAGVLYPFEALPSFLRHLHPVLAAGAMAFSSLSVVTNSLRLGKK